MCSSNDVFIGRRQTKCGSRLEFPVRLPLTSMRGQEPLRLYQRVGIRDLLA